jgi:hypothetical protein
MNINKEGEWHFPRVHHVGVVVKDINKAIKDVEAFGMTRSAYPKLPSWLENLLFKGKYFDTTYKLLGLGTFIHPMMYKIIGVGSNFADPNPVLPPLTVQPIFKGKPFNAEYRIFKIWLGDKILELIEPGKGESPWKDHLEAKGEGFHHIAFNVDDLNGVTSRMMKQGANRILYARIKENTGGDYLDLGFGLIVEIFTGYY